MISFDAWSGHRDPDGTWRLTFDRPGSSQNSIDVAVLDELDRWLDTIEEVGPGRGVEIVSGKPKGFCAGADLRALLTCRDATAVERLARRGFEVFGRLRALAVPTVAVVHGTCLGGGLELALACGERRLGEGAELRIGTPEVKLGLLPGWGAIGALPRRVGLEDGLRLLLDGAAVGPEEAARIGLIGPPRPIDWPPPGWDSALNAARGRITGGPAIEDRARLRLLDVLEAELRHGPDAGREAAVLGLAELATTPEARKAMRAIVERPR